MEKRNIISVLLILFVAISSVSFVSAWGWGAFECEGFNLEHPDGIEVATGYSPKDPPKYVVLVEDIDDDLEWNFVTSNLSEVPSDKLPDCIDIAENRTEDGCTIVKGQLTEDVSYNFNKGTNMTYAEFDKEGKHFYLSIDHRYSSLDQIDLTKDMNLAKELKESIKLK